MEPNKNTYFIMISIIAFAVIVAIFGGIYLYKQSTKAPTDTMARKYNSVDFRSKPSSQDAGYVMIKDKKIMYTITNQEVVSYIESKKADWESKEFSYPYGSYENSIISDGEKFTTIQNDDFVNVLYSDLKEKFSNSFEISLSLR